MQQVELLSRQTPEAVAVALLAPVALAALVGSQALAAQALAVARVQFLRRWARQVQQQAGQTAAQVAHRLDKQAAHEEQQLHSQTSPHLQTVAVAAAQEPTFHSTLAARAVTATFGRTTWARPLAPVVAAVVQAPITRWQEVAVVAYTVPELLAVVAQQQAQRLVAKASLSSRTRQLAFLGRWTPPKLEAIPLRQRGKLQTQ